ncbi:MAG TPA: aspartate dehydrogenase [Candidatus Blautia intestinavium]|nr:aspartate dehydrogenase [Candidatus Blautia intestinavium]HJC56244.1 aspartate dehydrogenase [Candidatus Eisenbergiella intestinipullorum]
MQPAMKSSICTGETVAGFLDAGGKFQEVMLLMQESDLELFCRKYGVKKEEIRHIF